MIRLTPSSQLLMNPPIIIDCSYLNDLLAQPEVLQRVIAKLTTTLFDPAIKARAYTRVVLTGMAARCTRSIRCIGP